jgi:ribonuclease HIII
MTELERIYTQVKSVLTEKKFTVNPPRPIQYGIQFLVFYQKKNGLIRIYHSKKGTRLDLSQVEDPAFSEKIAKLLHFLSSKPSPKKSSIVQPDAFNLDTVESLIGIDESGKGDYFGPLVVAGVYVSKDMKKFLTQLGVADSKTLSDRYMKEIAPEIKAHCPHSLVIMGNKSYNEIYEKINNLNHMLAWGHARVLENVLNQVDCQVALSDQFGNPALVQNNLMAKGRQITLFQRHGAESNLAVAAASILAREAFVSTLEKMEAAFEMNFPKGCSVETQKAAKAFVTRYGMESLNVVAKLHFKLTAALQQS